MLKKIIITGITGFVGTNLLDYFSKDYEIVGVSRKEHRSKNSISYAALSVSLLNEFSAFIHLAGKAHDIKKTADEKDYIEANTQLTKTVFKEFLESDCEVFIYLSSVKAAADSVQGVLDECFVPRPLTAYGKSKLAAEQYILEQDIPKNKRVYILRPCMIHGPNNKGNLNVLYGFVSKGIPYPFGSYNNQRSFVSVENLCFVIKELIENTHISSGVYHVADDGALSTNELVKIIGDTIGKPVNILKIPKSVVVILAKIGDLLPLPVNSERLQKLTESYVVSNAKIKKAIGKELPLSLKDGLRKTLTAFG